MSKRSEPRVKVQEGFDTIILEPRTTITSFDGIPWAIQKVVGGSIAAMLHGDNKEAKGQFYQSPTSRRNKEVLVQLASQVYSYLNSTISEFADVKDYAFRVWSQVTVDKRSGAIVGQPLFDVEIYKYVGRVSAQTVEMKDYALNVVFVGKKDDQFVSPFMQRALKRGTSATKYIRLEMYADARTSPKPIREKVVGGFPTLIIDKEAYAVKSKVDEATGKIQVYIEDKTGAFNLGSEKEVVLFLSKKSGLKPDILGLATAFQPVDREIGQISERIKASAKATEVDFLKSLGLEQVLQGIEQGLKSAKLQDLPEQSREKLKKALGELEEEKESYRALKIEYEVAQEELTSLKRDFEKGLVEHGTYDAARVRAITNQKKVEQQLVELQARVKAELTTKAKELANEIPRKGKRGEGKE